MNETGHRGDCGEVGEMRWNGEEKREKIDRWDIGILNTGG